MPEEAAEKWLHEFPERINQFQKYPEDWQDRVNARFASNVPEQETEQTDTEQTQENDPESTIEEQNDEELTGQSVKSRRGKKTANNVN